MRVHQITATLTYGDAIANDILEIDRHLKAWGLDSRIYAAYVEPQLSDRAGADTEYERFLNESGDVLIYHYSIYNANLRLYGQSANRKIVIYHNITPPEFYRGFDGHVETLCRLGRLALPELRGCELAFGDSEFNRQELIAAGIPKERTDVLPIFLDFDKFANAERDISLYQQIRRPDQVNVLYVGRLAPNKRCEDALKIMSTYRKYINPRAHLWLVGSRSFETYVRYLEALIQRMELQDAVTLADRVSINELRTYYEAAHVFLTASQHEGFGIPLLESMYFDLPILAYNSTAVPETLGGAGVCFNRLSYAELAEMLHLLATDLTLRQGIIAGQRRRLSQIRPEHAETKLRQALRRLGALQL